ncbi:putative Mg2+ transporter-C (MgtC) family protein [Bifidobacterium bohemicum]|uniref:MgtC family magnesium transporter n=1 Tax=Bifidobacterium bohemicum DSM 22767 TaxID=1437606 RepID=A0A086ZKD4_9BIFI|nr:MgtC/SapB family protein [Bifidobacterium bohemicum]KFI46984.1 MgtC family magnesium transporter [Bifidobacterium bohemicum DSM 22767]SCB86961.1 putative Mg2+ transporter-C (MgtC) family protein [Bifidobacterium bohemicum]
MNTLAWQTIWLIEAFVLSTAIGIERQARHKDAGMRTQALVGVGSALFVILSKYGFQDALNSSLMRLDPSRVAASIVSGIGFIGAGVVFTQRNHVHGLTTAASVWITAAIGSACGAGMWAPALACTALYFVAVLLFPPLIRRISPGLSSDDMLHLRYTDGHGTLRSILSVCASYGVSVEGFSTYKPKKLNSSGKDTESIVSADLEIRGRDSSALIRDLSELDGVLAVTRVNNGD